MDGTIQSSSSTPQLEEIITGSCTSQLEEIITESWTSQLEEIITEDGILSTILSSLPLIEAVRTSVLSSRWRHIWTCLTKFDFNAISVLGIHTLRPNTLAEEEAYNLTKGKTDEFIRAVNSILQQLQDTKLDTFAVGYFLHKTHSEHLDAWVRFALASKTKCLRLHLFRPYSNPHIQLYDIPCQLLGSSPFIQTLTLMTCSIKLPTKFDGLSNLKQLFLAFVHISEEDLNCILSNCRHILTKLGLVECPRLVAISVPHPLCQLQTLIVGTRYQLRKIEFNAVNLIKLSYQGAPVDFRFRQSSKLNEADIWFKTNRTMHNLDFYLTTVSRSLPHLQSLNLKINDASKVVNLPKCSSRCSHLTRLDLEWDVNVEMSLLDLTTLLDAAPLLQELKLHLSKPVLEQQHETPSKPRELLPKQPHTYLKMIEVCGFRFEMWQIEIAVYLLKSATGLESMTIEEVGEPSWSLSKEVREKGTEILSREAPANVKLVFL